jgi:hypothetical protein
MNERIAKTTRRVATSYIKIMQMLSFNGIEAAEVPV